MIEFFVVGPGALIIMFLIILVYRLTESGKAKAERILTKAYNRFLLGNYGDCIDLCNKAVKLHPHWFAYQLKARSYFDMREFKKARANANHSISLEPDPSANYHSYMVIRQLKGL